MTHLQPPVARWRRDLPSDRREMTRLRLDGTPKHCKESPNLMPLLTLKAKSRKPAQRAKLVVRANEKVTNLLEETGERVLVVYDGQAANIYYEDEPLPAPEPKAS